mmetsp:Transcript_6770/g.7516  ORF Transcript_6770/g.7516 Transcript_6770/m.7516 type:complete len:194 (-) Transcript_6770:288-869(-)
MELQKRKLLSNSLKWIQNSVPGLSQTPKFAFSRRTSSVLLLKDIPQGFRGENIEVKPGFARNYLIPYRFAVYDVPGHQERYLHDLDTEELEEKIRNRNWETFRNRFRSLKMTFGRPAVRGNAAMSQQPIKVTHVRDEIMKRLVKYPDVSVESVQMSGDLQLFGFHTATAEIVSENSNQSTSVAIEITLQSTKK